MRSRTRDGGCSNYVPAVETPRRLTQTEDDAAAVYARGHEQGLVQARLDGHDKKFDAINGSIGKFASVIETLTQVVTTTAVDIKARDDVAKALREDNAQRRQELHDADEQRRIHNQVEADAKARVLKDADDERAKKEAERVQKSEINWIPWARIFVVVTIAIQAVNMYFNATHKAG